MGLEDSILTSNQGHQLETHTQPSHLGVSNFIDQSQMTGRNPGVIQEERHSEPSDKKPASGTDGEET